jgi:hypothetical protein
MEVLRSFETPVLTRAIRLNIPEDAILPFYYVLFYSVNSFERNALERKRSKCKYVEIFTHRHVGSIGAPSRRTVFVRGTSAEQRESPNIAGRNTKANIF